MAEDFERQRLCPLMVASAWVPLVDKLGADDARLLVRCHGPRCAWYDQTAERCAVLSMARNK